MFISQYFGSALFTAPMLCDMETIISLRQCSGFMEDQIALIVAFKSSALVGLMDLIFLLTIPHRMSIGFRSGEFVGLSSTVTEPPFGTFGSVGRCQVLLENEISISIKPISRRRQEDGR
ncbi:hypothetical protein CHARACLAT_003753 [Characodon lateralis]|uniref:Uncharacterized protein n=1 Tax=Characodon lateralis TaxID=208331 RepID=A0ABU7CUM8_9TELE|nr:hypothetical protein [Characodon lateralis]